MSNYDTDLIEYIDHSAVVVNVDQKSQTVTVATSDKEDCDGCPAARLCSIASSDNKNSRITVKSPLAASLHPGDRVWLRGTEQMHRRAIALATVLPCLALIIVMVAVYVLTGTQATAAIAGLVSMVFFFSLLYLLRNKIAHEFSFTLHPYSDL